MRRHRANATVDDVNAATHGRLPGSGAMLETPLLDAETQLATESFLDHQESAARAHRRRQHQQQMPGGQPSSFDNYTYGGGGHGEGGRRGGAGSPRVGFDRHDSQVMSDSQMGMSNRSALGAFPSFRLGLVSSRSYDDAQRRQEADFQQKFQNFDPDELAQAVIDGSSDEDPMRGDGPQTNEALRRHAVRTATKHRRRQRGGHESPSTHGGNSRSHPHHPASSHLHGHGRHHSGPKQQDRSSATTHSAPVLGRRSDTATSPSLASGGISREQTTSAFAMSPVFSLEGSPTFPQGGRAFPASGPGRAGPTNPNADANTRNSAGNPTSVQDRSRANAGGPADDNHQIQTRDRTLSFEFNSGSDSETNEQKEMQQRMKKVAGEARRRRGNTFTGAAGAPGVLPRTPMHGPRDMSGPPPIAIPSMAPHSSNYAHHARGLDQSQRGPGRRESTAEYSHRFGGDAASTRAPSVTGLSSGGPQHHNDDQEGVTRYGNGLEPIGHSGRGGGGHGDGRGDGSGSDGDEEGRKDDDGEGGGDDDDFVVVQPGDEIDDFAVDLTQLLDDTVLATAPTFDIPPPFAKTHVAQGKITQARYITERLLNARDAYDPDVFRLCENYHDRQREYHNRLKVAETKQRESRLFRLPPRDLLFVLLSDPESCAAGRKIAWVSAALVLISVLQFILETVPAFNPEFEPGMTDVWFAMELIVTVAFTLDTVVRFCLCRTKLRFFWNVLNWTDIIAVLPFYVFLFIDTKFGAWIKLLRLCRTGRIFRRYHHIDALRVTLQKSWRLLLAPAAVFGLTIYGLALALHVVEGGTFREAPAELVHNLTLRFSNASSISGKTGEDAVNEYLALHTTFNRYMQEDCACTATAAYLYGNRTCPERTAVFQSAVETLWFSVVALTTTGYGDFAPTCSLGKFVTGLAMLMSVVFLAMPIAIVGESFTETVAEFRAADLAAKAKRAKKITALRQRAEKATAQQQQAQVALRRRQQQNLGYMPNTNDDARPPQHDNRDSHAQNHGGYRGGGRGDFGVGDDGSRGKAGGAHHSSRDRDDPRDHTRGGQRANRSGGANGRGENDESQLTPTANALQAAAAALEVDAAAEAAATMSPYGSFRKIRRPPVSPHNAAATAPDGSASPRLGSSPRGSPRTSPRTSFRVSPRSNLHQHMTDLHGGSSSAGVGRVEGSNPASGPQSNNNSLTAADRATAATENNASPMGPGKANGLDFSGRSDVFGRPLSSDGESGESQPLSADGAMSFSLPMIRSVGVSPVPTPRGPGPMEAPPKPSIMNPNDQHSIGNATASPIPAGDRASSNKPPLQDDVETDNEVNERGKASPGYTFPTEHNEDDDDDDDGRRTQRTQGDSSMKQDHIQRRHSGPPLPQRPPQDHQAPPVPSSPHHHPRPDSPTKPRDDGVSTAAEGLFRYLSVALNRSHCDFLSLIEATGPDVGTKDTPKGLRVAALAHCVNTYLTPLFEKWTHAWATAAVSRYEQRRRARLLAAKRGATPAHRKSIEDRPPHPLASMDLRPLFPELSLRFQCAQSQPKRLQHALALAAASAAGSGGLANAWSTASGGGAGGGFSFSGGAGSASHISGATKPFYYAQSGGKAHVPSALEMLQFEDEDLLEEEEGVNDGFGTARLNTAAELPVDAAPLLFSIIAVDTSSRRAPPQSCSPQVQQQQHAPQPQLQDENQPTTGQRSGNGRGGAGVGEQLQQLGAHQPQPQAPLQFGQFQRRARDIDLDATDGTLSSEPTRGPLLGHPQHVDPHNPQNVNPRLGSHPGEESAMRACHSHDLGLTDTEAMATRPRAPTAFHNTSRFGMACAHDDFSSGFVNDNDTGETPAATPAATRFPSHSPFRLDGSLGLGGGGSAGGGGPHGGNGGVAAFDECHASVNDSTSLHPTDVGSIPVSFTTAQGVVHSTPIANAFCEDLALPQRVAFLSVQRTFWGRRVRIYPATPGHSISVNGTIVDAESGVEVKHGDRIDLAPSMPLSAVGVARVAKARKLRDLARMVTSGQSAGRAVPPAAFSASDLLEAEIYPLTFTADFVPTAPA